MTTREFEFSEGTSNKFWRITVDGPTQTVYYGRIGTNGQEQTKTFANDAEAKVASDKLIAEKVKKGYAEIGAAHTSSPAAPPPVSVTRAPAPDDTAAMEVPATLADANIVPATTTSSQAKPADLDGDPFDVPISINITEDDFQRAGLRPRVRKTPPAPKPFDVKEVSKRIADTVKQPYWDQKDVKIDPALSREEAELWIYAVAARKHAPFGGVISFTYVELESAANQTGVDSQMIATAIKQRLPFTACHVLNRLLPPNEFARSLVVWFESDHMYYRRSMELVDWLRSSLLPYLADDEVVGMLPEITPLLEAPRFNPHTFYLAGCLGAREQMRATIVSRPASDFRAIDSTCLSQLVLSLGDADFADAQMTRMGIFLNSNADARQWLALAGVQGLDRIVNLKFRASDKAESEAVVRTAGRVVAPETAPYLLAWMREQKAPSLCKQWFDEHPKHTAAGLTPLLDSGDDDTKAAAASVLRNLVKRGHGRTVAAYVDRLSDAVREFAQAVIFTDSESNARYEPLTDAEIPTLLRDAAKGRYKPKPGDPLMDDLPQVVVTVDAGLLPGVHVHRGLPENLYHAVLAGLRTSTLDAPDPIASALKSLAEPRSLDAFAWALFERWLSDGAPSKEKWQMTSIGLLGGDASALKLAPLIRKWPGEAQHQRAVLGLECLRAIGSDTALMQINGIANKVAFKGIKQRAQECMDDIAKARGMTRAQLEDRIVPDCDLDDRGSRVFDFGPRQFRLALSPEMKAMVKDDAGKITSDLPKPNSKDDADKAEAAVAEWKLLKKQVSEVAKIQAGRLEQVMVTGRRWSAGEFDQLLVRHPLMTNLARLLLWGVYDDANTLTSSFRVTEDQTFADASDSTYEMPAGVQVGVVHPLHLTPEEMAAWGEIWADYEIVPPFPQLGRTIYSIAADERDVVNLERFGNARIPSASLIFGLEKFGWFRAIPADAGHFWEHSKPFPSTNVTAFVQYDPGAFPYGIAEAGPQRVEGVYFVPGVHGPEMYSNHQKRVKWGDVDSVVVSEVLSDLTAIYSKVT